jgi:hypothetical protein
MPDTSLSDAIKEAYASAPSDVIDYHTLEFRHASFATPIRVVRDTVNLVATLEADAPENPGEAVTFIGYAFEFDMPELTPDAAPEITITIDNVSLDIEDALNAAIQTTDVVEVTYRPYLSSDLSAPSMDPPLTMTVKTISATQFQITARASIGDYANRKFPFEEYTRTRFPGLVR